VKRAAATLGDQRRKRSSHCVRLRAELARSIISQGSRLAIAAERQQAQAETAALGQMLPLRADCKPLNIKLACEADRVRSAAGDDLTMARASDGRRHHSWACAGTRCASG
jgi:hypothetical protein